MSQVKRKAVRMADKSLSPKAMIAFILPALGTLVLVLINEFLSPHIDSTLKVAIVGFVNALLALAGAWAGPPGRVVINE